MELNEGASEAGRGIAAESRRSVLPGMTPLCRFIPSKPIGAADAVQCPKLKVVFRTSIFYTMLSFEAAQVQPRHAVLPKPKIRAVECCPGSSSTLSWQTLAFPGHGCHRCAASAF